MSQTTEALKHVLADTYTLSLKTQNYHWNVTGALFDPLHQLFGRQYGEMTVAIDEIAERIRALGVVTPATFKEFAKLSSIKEGKSSLAAEDMVEDLRNSHNQIVKTLSKALNAAEHEDDVFTVDMLTARIGAHQKDAWMLSATLGTTLNSVEAKPLREAS